MNLRRKVLMVGAMVLAIGGISLVEAQDIPADYQEVLKVLAKRGDYADNVLKVGIPRNDLNVTIAGVNTPTAFGFGGWLGFTKGEGGMDVMMGDLVLLQHEVNPVMSVLLDNGLEVTALHNHFFWDDPHVFYMHVHGHGKSAELARQVKPALDLIGHLQATGGAKAVKPSGNLTTPNGIPAVEGKLNSEKLEQIIGHKGDLMGSVFKITIGRDDLKLKEMGATINSRMGLNTWAAFVGTDDTAAVAGDVAMLESEVTSVLKALRSNGLDVVAIHHHMTGTTPMIIFLHYWGVGPAEKLASGFRAALNQLGGKENQSMHMNSRE